MRVDRKVWRGSSETLTKVLRDAVLPRVAQSVAKAEVAVEIDLSDDYDDLRD
jgi:hypothetical protein